MINTVLFDLDGTLLPINDKVFEKLYFGGLVEHLKDLISAQDLIELIWACIQETVLDISDKTNEEAFFEAMAKRVDAQKLETMKQRFMHFYATDFDRVRHAVVPSPTLKEAIHKLKDKGYRCVIATNPLFPRLAIEKRIEWTGIERHHFDYVSSFEDNHFCKPQVKFYQEILDHIHAQADECLMVGNDATEDMIARTLGIQTFLLTDHKIQKGDHFYKADAEGDAKAFLDFVCDLPKLS